MRGNQKTPPERLVMVATQFKLTEEQFELLRRYSEREQRSTSGAVRYIVCRFLADLQDTGDAVVFQSFKDASHNTEAESRHE